MERTKESRKSIYMAAGGGSGSSSSSGLVLSKRRHRTTNEDIEKQEMVGLKDGVSKKEKEMESNGDLLNSNKRRREMNSRQEDVVVEDGGEAPVRHVSSFRAVVDDIISGGVSIPRKRRSVLAKMLQKSWISSPVKKKMKQSGPKTRLPRVLSGRTSVQTVEEDIEIEIAEVLFGLKNKREEDNKDTNAQNTSILAHNCGLVRVASKKQKVEADDPSTSPLQDYSSFKDGSQQPKKIEIVATGLEKKSDMNGSVISSIPPEFHKEGIKQEDCKSVTEESAVAKEEASVLKKEESASSAKNLNLLFQDSTIEKSSSVLSEIDVKHEEKFKIDLMAPPPMASPPELDSFIHLSLNSKPTSGDMEKATEQAEKLTKKEPDKKTKINREKKELRLDLEKPINERSSDISKLQQKLKAETTAQSSSLSLPFALPGWAGALPHLSYIPPFRSVPHVDGTAGLSGVLQPRFPLLQPRPKRCATHHYIASYIRLRQQFTKVHHLHPEPVGSAAFDGNKVNSSNAIKKMIIGNPVHGSFPVLNTNPAQDKGQVVGNIPVFTKIDSSNGSKVVDSTQKKQVLVHQSPQPAPAGNLQHGGPAFIFSFPQFQTPATWAGSHSEPSKSTALTNHASSSSKAITAVTANPSALPAAGAAMSFSYHNGYSFPVSTTIGNQPVFRGGNPAQVLPFYNGSFYPSQMLHPSQLQQYQPHSLPPIQPVHLNACSSSASSSSQKQPLTSQPHKPQNLGNNYLVSTNVQSQQQHKQHVPSHQHRKLKAEISRETTQKVVDTRAAHSQRSAHGQNPMHPLQPNFALIPSTAISGKPVEKQQSQEKNLMGGVEVIPSQAVSLSYASFNGGKTPSNLNFSAMAQNPAVFQSFPDLSHQGYQVRSAHQCTQKKNYQLSDKKIGSGVSNPDDRKKINTPNNEQTLVFDNSSRTLNFVPSSFMRNWPSSSLTSAANVGAVSAPFSQKHQLIQSQMPHMLHQQIQPRQQQNLNGAGRSKTPTGHGLPPSSIDFNFSNNAPMFMQLNSSSQSSEWTSSPKNPATQASLAPVEVAKTPTPKDAPHYQGRTAKGQISFGENSTPSLMLGQLIPPTARSSSVIGAGTAPSGSNLRIASTSVKTANSSVTVLQSQQGDNSSAGNGKKSSPVCGRDVPSILSTCPAQLSELK